MSGNLDGVWDARIARRLGSKRRAMPATIIYHDDKGYLHRRSERLCSLALQIDCAAQQIAGRDVKIIMRMQSGPEVIQPPFRSIEGAWRYLVAQGDHFTGRGEVRFRVVWLTKRHDAALPPDDCLDAAVALGWEVERPAAPEPEQPEPEDDAPADDLNPSVISLAARRRRSARR